MNNFNIVVTTNIKEPKQKIQQRIVIKVGVIFNFLLHYNESRFVLELFVEQTFSFTHKRT